MPIIQPFEKPPAPGAVTEVAPGILWARLPLPFRLDHVNVYFIEDDHGWAIMDCGIANAETRAIWRALLDGPLRGQVITKVIVTHFHPDHI
ncbi:MAG: MBL fold metallo-hydrolase [Rhizobiaceae bacterium]